MSQPLIGIVMGSQSDWPTMRAAAEVLDALGVPYETRIVSAHRTPDRMFAYAEAAPGGACARSSPGPGGRRTCRACWPRRRACRCSACRCRARRCRGSIACSRSCRCRRACRSATFAIGAAGAANAGLFAAAMLATTDPALAERLEAWRAAQTAAVAEEPSR